MLVSKFTFEIDEKMFFDKFFIFRILVLCAPDDDGAPAPGIVKTFHLLTGNMVNSSSYSRENEFDSKVCFVTDDLERCTRLLQIVGVVFGHN